MNRFTVDGVRSPKGFTVNGVRFTVKDDARYTLGDQLIRAGLSVSNNLAEGAGKRSKKEKAKVLRHFLRLDTGMHFDVQRAEAATAHPT